MTSLPNFLSAVKEWLNYEDQMQNEKRLTRKFRMDHLVPYTNHLQSTKSIFKNGLFISHKLYIHIYIYISAENFLRQYNQKFYCKNWKNYFLYQLIKRQTKCKCPLSVHTTLATIASILDRRRVVGSEGCICNKWWRKDWLIAMKSFFKAKSLSKISEIKFYLFMKW